MIAHDFECNSCKSIFEAMVEMDGQRQIHCHYCQTGVANRVFLKAPGFNGRNKGVYPRFDTQLGCVLDSSQHMERVAKARGLAIMGNEEWTRSRNAPRTPDPMDSDEPDPKLIEIAKRAWDDVKYGRVAPEVEEVRVMDVVKESDVLNVKDAPKLSGA
jgi:DNA-directed RNA polymerase subunit RPC12/RpoP